MAKKKQSMKDKLMSSFGNIAGTTTGEPEVEEIDITDDDDLDLDKDRCETADTLEDEGPVAEDPRSKTASVQPEEAQKPAEAVLQAPEASSATSLPESVSLPEGEGSAGALADPGANHRLTTCIPEKMVTYLRIRAASEGVFKAQISYMLMKLIREDMENHKDLTNF